MLSEQFMLGEHSCTWVGLSYSGAGFVQHSVGFDITLSVGDFIVIVCYLTLKKVVLFVYFFRIVCIYAAL